MVEISIDVETPEAVQQPLPGSQPKELVRCDRCGEAMIEANCKILCTNCGNRFDCSDLTLYFDRD